MNIKKRKLIGLLLFLVCGLAPIHLLAEPSSSLANLPPYYPEYFENSAVLTGIDKKNSEMVFGVLRVKYDQNIQVHLLNTEFGTIDQLQSGMPVAFSLYSGSLKNGQIKQLWQLPVGAIPAH